jgi:drug/metabolite transporter (DMT)-like permease
MNHPLISNPLIKTYVLLGLVVLVWGLLWPINKFGLYYMPPLWYASLRLIIATICMFLLAKILGQLSIPKGRDWPMILILGFFQTGLFLGFLTIGLNQVGAGRAAILVYSTPIWVTPIAYFFFNEQLSRLKLLGVILGAAGILLLFSPWGLDWSDKKVIIGNILLLAAALSWAFAMIFSRYMPWHSSVLQITPWQLLFATIPVSLFAMFLEPSPHIVWNTPLIISLIYASLLGTAFAFWGIVAVSKQLPVITTSLALLGVPITSVIASALFLHEPITVNIFFAMILVLGGLAVASLSNRKPIETVSNVTD